jgi:hypothetical protein
MHMRTVTGYTQALGSRNKEDTQGQGEVALDHWHR